MTRQAPGPIRPVDYQPRTAVGDIDVFTFGDLRLRAPRGEFALPQRLSFDMVMRIDKGPASHTVDFTTYPLTAGDVIWVRTGQVQQWSEVADVEGVIVLFQPHVLSNPHLYGSVTAAPGRTHFPAAGNLSPRLDAAFDELTALPARANTMTPELHQDLLAHRLHVMLAELLAADSLGSLQAASPAEELYRWFCDEIDARFSTMHKVSDYANRLGYSAKTINRATRRNAGLSAKQLIDQRIILEAKRLLAHDEAPLTDIAAELGFDDPVAFPKFFTHREGQPPSDFRRQVRR